MSKRYELVPSMNLEGKSNGRLIRDNEEDCTLTAVEICLKLNKQDERIKDFEDEIRYIVESMEMYEDDEKIKLEKKIQELENKMNYQAFELYKYGVVSIGKAVELSNMSYHDFIKYCADNGHPVELRL